ncbi:hypothetical protein [Streptomyces anulatus]|uniref:hypothetical protein n=1 Tax=Streptomyces anulatus TaxID=1892 RepID=UPI0036ACAD84
MPSHVAEHYGSLTANELIASVFDHYDRLRPCIEELVTAHAAEDRGSTGLALEVSALWPVRVARPQAPHTAAVLLTSDDSLLHARVHAARCYEAATDEGGILMDKLLARTERYQALMADGAGSVIYRSVTIHGGSPTAYADAKRMCRASAVVTVGTR